MIYDVRTYPYQRIADAPIQKPRKGQRPKRFYKDIICAFDIETTAIEEIKQSIMYVWQLQVGKDDTIIGRTWDEYLLCVNNIQRNIKGNESLVIFVHNLSYEFQFLSGIYDFCEDEVKLVKSRKVLTCTMFDKKLEYRCSFLHSNYTLSKYLSNMNVEHKKTTLDYSQKRYSWTTLTEDELEYVINDVKGLVEAIEVDMKIENDNLYSFPLTSTGYVRRDIKYALSNGKGKAWLSDIHPEYKIHKLLRQAFRGGNTHANRYYAGVILDDVKSIDRVSSYPDELVNRDFPVTKFEEVNISSEAEIVNLVKRRYALLLEVEMFHVEQKDVFYGCPYLSLHKCYNIEGFGIDNGRVLYAKKLTTVITDVDYEIIRTQYSYTKLNVLQCYTSKYGKLPKEVINTILQYYKKKTELKNIDGKQLEYSKSKEKLNSIYGLSAQDPAKEEIIYRNGEYVKSDKHLEELYEESCRKIRMPYQWGVWTTAFARLDLEIGIRLAGNGFIYCDTDSVKYIDDISIDEYNKRCMKASASSGAMAVDKHGETHYMGVYESEKSYKRFITWGAKKYAYEYEDGTLGITIAGVAKKEGAEQLQRVGLEALVPGYVFDGGAGGLTSKFNDENYGEYVVEGRKLNITKNIYLYESTYKLGITEDYEDIIYNCDEKDYCKKFDLMLDELDVMCYYNSGQ